VGGEEAAAVLRVVGAQREFDFPPSDHLALGAALGLLDFDAGAPPGDALVAWSSSWCESSGPGASERQLLYIYVCGRLD
jgi:hypothetical protein